MDAFLATLADAGRDATLACEARNARADSVTLGAGARWIAGVLDPEEIPAGAAPAWALAGMWGAIARLLPAKTHAATRMRVDSKLRIPPPLSAMSVTNPSRLSNKKKREFLGLAISSKKNSQSQGAMASFRRQKTRQRNGQILQAAKTDYKRHAASNGRPAAPAPVLPRAPTRPLVMPRRPWPPDPHPPWNRQAHPQL